MYPIILFRQKKYSNVVLSRSLHVYSTKRHDVFFLSTSSLLFLHQQEIEFTFGDRGERWRLSFSPNSFTLIFPHLAAFGKPAVFKNSSQSVLHNPVSVADTILPKCLLCYVHMNTHHILVVVVVQVSPEKFAENSHTCCCHQPWLRTPSLDEPKFVIEWGKQLNFLLLRFNYTKRPSKKCLIWSTKGVQVPLAGVWNGVNFSE